MRIAICDDETSDRRAISTFVKLHSETHEIVEFKSANMFLDELERKSLFDLVFLDIQMPDSNGWEVAKLLKQSRSKVYIAMITVILEYLHIEQGTSMHMKIGDTVQMGAKIGNVGGSTGYAIHLDLRVILNGYNLDPLRFFDIEKHFSRWVY